MNAIFMGIVGIAFAMGAVRQIVWDGVGEAPMAVLGKAMIDAAGGSVTLAIGLVGVMALFLGLMKVACRPMRSASATRRRPSASAPCSNWTN